MDYDTEMKEHDAWERSCRLLQNLVDKLGEDAPLSLALGMAKLFEPLRPGSARWYEVQKGEK